MSGRGHQFVIRITVLVERASSRVPVPALARWRGWSRGSRAGKVLPEQMSWREANAATGHLLSHVEAASGRVYRFDEGQTWCRGWGGRDVDALVANAALMC